MLDVKRIALLISEDIAFGRNIMHGIHQYARPTLPWVFRTALPVPATLPPLAEWNPDGIIVQLHHLELWPELKRLGKPVVNISAMHPQIDFPRVANDDRATGALAARFLLDKRLAHLAYCGHSADGASSLRQQGFYEVAKQGGVTPFVFEYTSAFPFQSSLSWLDEDIAVRHWLRGLPKPVGILAYNDLGALRMSEVCHQAKLRVPEDIAIVGVDNDELKCQMTYPPLSSIELAGESIGYQAGRLLKNLMSGITSPPHAVYLLPIRLVARGSSDFQAMPEPEVIAAINYILAHIQEPIRVEDILQAVPVGRRWLERRFRILFNRGIAQEIRRQRIDMAKSLLLKSELSLTEIASATGFANQSYLSIVFKQETGVTPTEYLREYTTQA